MKNLSLFSILFIVSTFYSSLIGYPSNLHRPSADTSVQNNLIPIAVVIPELTEFDSESNRQILRNKLNFMVTKNGMGGNLQSPRFMIYPQISVLDKEYTTTAPVKTVLIFELNLFVTDYIDQKKFGSIAIKLKGIGNSDEMALRNALKNFKNSDYIQQFLKQSKDRIIDYYQENCTLIMDEANLCADQKEYAKALELLYNIPQFTSCKSEAIQNARAIYIQFFNNDCQGYLQLAKKQWANYDIGNALDNLSMIYPECSCYEEASMIYQEVKQKVNELSLKAEKEKEEAKKKQYENELKEWEFCTKQYELAIEEYQKNDRYKKEIEERAFQLAIEEAKSNSDKRSTLQQNSFFY